MVSMLALFSNQTGITQIPQVDLMFHKDGNWKIIK